jgi:TonB family protein
MRKSLPSITFFCLTATLVFLATTSEAKRTVFAAEKQQDDHLVQDSSSALQSWMNGLVDAIKTKDSAREKQLIESLIMPRDASWFSEHFDKNTAVLLRSAYAESMKDFEATARSLFEADVKRGLTVVHVNRYADPNTAPSPIDRQLESMTTRAPLYEVATNGNRASFQIAISPTGGPSKVVAGDLDGFFVETSEGFRYIPSSVLTIAVQEREKQNYEVLDKDADGRPTVVQMKSTALTVIDRAYPTYPEAARAKHIGGTVRVSARIGKDGRVKDANVKTGPQELQKAALDCVKKWRFKPVQIDGHPVEVESEFAVAFSVS